MVNKAQLMCTSLMLLISFKDPVNLQFYCHAIGLFLQNTYCKQDDLFKLSQVCTFHSKLY